MATRAATASYWTTPPKRRPSPYPRAPARPRATRSPLAFPQTSMRSAGRPASDFTFRPRPSRGAIMTSTGRCTAPTTSTSPRLTTGPISRRRCLPPARITSSSTARTPPTRRGSGITSRSARASFRRRLSRSTRRSPATSSTRVTRQRTPSRAQPARRSTSARWNRPRGPRPSWLRRAEINSSTPAIPIKVPSRSLSRARTRSTCPTRTARPDRLASFWTTQPRRRPSP